jgi:catechol 2,3-dioxygenase-like lactoylglutathione lyase family enzyme
MPSTAKSEQLQAIDHIAISVGSIPEAVAWYTEKFSCQVAYQDDTWAMLCFGNIRLALISGGPHPPHIGLMRPDAEQFGELRPHRDGTRSVYLQDPFGNWVEILKQE